MVAASFPYHLRIPARAVWFQVVTAAKHLLFPLCLEIVRLRGLSGARQKQKHVFERKVCRRRMPQVHCWQCKPEHTAFNRIDAYSFGGSA
jgi:hypothetical protein